MANRKLQSEIEKVLKKVSEGVDIFEGIFDKIQTTSNATQKEKFEMDLKKEIKKLQRYRDQIKTWLSSNEIKDKRALTENRKLIEHQMEKFKACEKELKTKAYSKEGLSLPGKIDPQEKEKGLLSTWLTETIDELQTQCDALEAEEETMKLEKKKQRKPDPAKTERVLQIERHLERHKWHISQLEIVLRMLENGDLSVDKVKTIKDDVEFYVGNSQDSDFQEDEGIYDDLGLDEVADYGAIGHEDDKDTNDDSESESEVPQRELSSPAKPGVRVVPNRTIVSAKPPPAPAPKPVHPVPPKPTVTVLTRSQTLPGRIVSDSTTPLPQRYSAAASASVSDAVKISEDKKTKVTTPSPVSVNSTQPSILGSKQNQSPSVTNFSLPSSSTSPEQPSQPTHSAESSQKAAPSSTSSPQQPQQASSSTQPTLTATDLKVEVSSETINPVLPASLADLEASFESAKDRSNKAKDDRLFQNELFESSYQNLPQVFDSERPSHYMPKTPYPAPSYYPQTNSMQISGMLEKVDIDTLFFIFYYQAGTYQQYLAARELKKQSWRFHKKYLTWFQRHEEPKAITEEYEQGTYIYFDYEGAWCQRKKSEFRFEYRYLEDGELQY